MSAHTHTHTQRLNRGILGCIHHVLCTSYQCSRTPHFFFVATLVALCTPLGYNLGYRNFRGTSFHSLPSEQITMSERSSAAPMTLRRAVSSKFISEKPRSQIEVSTAKQRTISTRRSTSKKCCASDLPYEVRGYEKHDFIMINVG